MKITVASGKGGTGKTSIVASFAALAQNVVLADCNVDAVDLYLVLQPSIKQTYDFSGGKKASIITEVCVGCGKCEEVCNFDAVTFKGPANDVCEKTYIIDPIACEGCGVCFHFCPNDAIEFKDTVNSRWFISYTRFGPMVHVKLGIAEENSGKLVSLIRKEAGRIAEERKKDLTIIDGSPGIGFPVIASITGADLVLILTEPTLLGKHDLYRIADLAAGFGIPALVVINKFNLNADIPGQIEADVRERNVKAIGKIHYDNVFTRAQIMKGSVVEYTGGAVT